MHVRVLRFQGAWYDGKGFEICTAGLEFESGRVPLVRAWDIRGFTRLPEPTKYAFRRWGFLESKKKMYVFYKNFFL
jgi:hypothetical protein